LTEPPADKPKGPVLFAKGRILAAFVNKTMHQLKPAEVCVWLALFAWVSLETGLVSMPIKRIAGLTGLSTATVKRAMRRLRQLGLVTTVKRGNVFVRLPGVYRLRGLIQDQEEEE
jgi:hypothetical protein